MRKYFSRKYLFPILAFCIIDLIAIGAGMGVPIFAILFGFIVGWIAPSIIIPSATNLRQLLRECVFVSLLTSCFTFLVMIILWGPVTRMLLETSADYVNFGIPMILYDPKVSFIGWIILMIFISPILQLLATVFSSAVHIVWRIPNSLGEESKPM
jgi:hypothetical protein